MNVSVECHFNSDIVRPPLRPFVICRMKAFYGRPVLRNAHEHRLLAARKPGRTFALTVCEEFQYRYNHPGNPVAILRETIVWSASTISAPTGIASTPTCGDDACPPCPVILMSNRLHWRISDPQRGRNLPDRSRLEDYEMALNLIHRECFRTKPFVNHSPAHAPTRSLALAGK